MANNKFPRAAASSDTGQINVNDPNEMRMWVKAFGVTKEQLEAAVQSAGPDALKVRLQLSKQTQVPS